MERKKLAWPNQLFGRVVYDHSCSDDELLRSWEHDPVEDRERGVGQCHNDHGLYVVSCTYLPWQSAVSFRRERNNRVGFRLGVVQGAVQHDRKSQLSQQFARRRCSQCSEIDNKIGAAPRPFVMG